MLKQDSRGELPSHYRFISWGVVIAATVLIVVIRTRLLSMPLERDEGEFAYMGQLMLQGIPPYAVAANMKLPGTYAAYALIMAVFGQTVRGIHLGLLLVNLSTMLLVFLLGRKLFGDVTGAVACAAYGMLSLSPGVQGTSAHATHFVLLPALGGLLVLLRALERGMPGTFFLSGILLGLAFLMKQPGVVFGLFGLLFLLGTGLYKTPSPAQSLPIRALLFVSGLLMPCLLTCLALYALGVFEKFWFWTVSYAFQYGTLRSVAGGIRMLQDKLPKVVGSFYLLWGVACAGFFAVILDRGLRGRAVFIFGFLAFSFLGVCPGFYFREHYFVLILPAVGLFSGVAVTFLAKRCVSVKVVSLVSGLLLLVCLFHGVLLEKRFFFTLSPDMACRHLYFPNPFPESLEIADYIRNHSTPDSTIAVLGSEPQIYFYAQRRSATSYLYTYSLMEKHRYAETMQKEMIREIAGNKPEYIIWVNVPYSWFIRTNSEMLLLNWFADYKNRYSLVGIIDIISPDQTKYLWGDEAQKYMPGSNHVALLKRTM